MKNLKRLFLSAGLALAVGLSITACGNKTENAESNSEIKSTVAQVEKAGVTEEKPILVDKEKKTVTVLAKVNGKYFDQGTRHALVFKDGKFGDKPILISLADQNTFYNSLIEIGAKPGNNMTPENAEKTQVEGDKINVTVTWDGAEKDYDINEVVKDSNGKKIDMRFGGNQERAKGKNTGCLACLDSCPVGIVSNHTYAYGAVEKRMEASFSGNSEVLPADGTYVAVTFALAQ